MHNTLKHYFGYDSFRPDQEEVISHVMEGNDALVIMPTGGGKSLCFQLPALLFDGLTIVISPLIALMKDQVDALKANGISAAYLNSSLDDMQRQEIRQQIRNKEIKLLYLAPESLQMLEMIRDLSPISLIAIDEAHCISSWGHDFRPAYTNLQILKKLFPQVPLIALTATADKTTRGDMLSQLGIPKAKVFISSFDRPNLSLSVRPGQKRIEQILAYLSTRPNESGIIYCLSRGSTEKVAEKLQAAGLSAKAYHAGLDHKKRQKVQDEFLSDETGIICATIAFGMGIDKSNVRFVIHYNLPKNIEGYYQEIGRAGRDGADADTLLFYSYADVLLLTKFAQDSGNKDVQIAKLERMKQYAESLTCRRKILLHYFGEAREENCGNCDVCLHPPEIFDGTEIAQKALSTVYRLQQSQAMKTVIDVLRGSKNLHIINNNFQELSTHGVGGGISLPDRQWYLIQLLNLGYLEVAFDQHDALKLTEAAGGVLFDGASVQLAKPHQTHISQAPSKNAPTAQKSLKVSLIDQLKLLRLSLSKQENISGQSILSDVTIFELDQVQPTSIQMLSQIQGIGEAKLQTYGNQIIQVVVAYQTLVGRRKPRGGVGKGSTFLKTYHLLQQGKTPHEIAKERDLGVGTVYTHIGRLHSSGKDVDINKYISDEKIEMIGRAFAEVNHQGKLKPLFEYLNGAVTYDEIKLGMSVVEKNNLD